MRTECGAGGDAEEKLLSWIISGANAWTGDGAVGGLVTPSADDERGIAIGVG